ncbi:MAG: hypothetical protein PF485_04375 [Bacteroidales bacterium]|jgi:hypothetical protein|nr:hypothetical protein [Bacteroidales bacterium]
MRKIIVLVLLIIISFSCYSQDVLTRTNGDIIECKIQKEDSTFIYFKTFIKNKLIETHLPISEISSIKYYTYGQSNAEIDTIVEIEKKEIVTKAIGLGLDYGGLVGFKLTFNIFEDVGIFGGLGWAFMDFGYNVGIKLNIPSRLNINPYLQAMYGYNAGINIYDKPDYNKKFNGGTVGFGLDFKSSKRRSYWTVG